jgi:hypothetical protein
LLSRLQEIDPGFVGIRIICDPLWNSLPAADPGTEYMVLMDAFIDLSLLHPTPTFPQTTQTPSVPRRSRSKAAAAVQAHGGGSPQGMAPAAFPFPAHRHGLLPPGAFQPRALLAPAVELPSGLESQPGAQPQPPAPLRDSPVPMAEAAVPAETVAPVPQSVAPAPVAREGDETEAPQTEAATLMRELGMEPDPGTPEALALLAEAGISPRPAPGEPLGPDDTRFSPIAIGHLTHRLVEVKRLLEPLNSEQKDIHETLRLAHLRGDLLHLLAPSSEGWCYQLANGVHLTRRQGRKQWTYSAHWAELEAQLKARQTYKQATGDATWRHGAAFWEIRGRKG